MSTEKPKLVVTTGPFKNIIILGHSSVEERDTEAGKVGSTLEDADYSDIYRSTLPEIHDKATKVIEDLSGIPRGINEAQTAKNQARLKDGKVAKPVKESFVDFATRVKAAVEESIWTSIDEEFRAIALATPVDASPSKRAGTASKANLEKADEILARGEDAIEETVTKLLTVVPNFDLDRDSDSKPERVSLARLVGAYVEAQKLTL
jgi:hypothetical protein